MPRKYISLDALEDLSIHDNDFSFHSGALDGVGTGHNSANGSRGSAARSRPQRGPPRPKKSHGKASRRPMTGVEYANVIGRFVVEPGLPLPSPDQVIPHAKIMRVVAPTSQCPICLDTAKVPRMLDCGHIMCLTCFIKFRRYAEVRICPMCPQYVSTHALPVTFMSCDEDFLPKPTHEVVLRLMKRDPKGLPHPVDSPPTSSVATRLEYERVVDATPEYLRAESRREVRELEVQRKEALEEYDDDDGFPDAIQICKQELSTACGLDPKDDEGGKPKPKHKPRHPKQLPDADSEPATPYYYYQTGFESPTVYVLSPLDVSVLRTSFGDYENFPANLIVKIDNIVHTTLDDDHDVRQRLKYLSHLPSQSSVALLECDWRGIASEPAMRKYGKQLADRRRKHKDQDRRDNKARREAQQLLDVQMRAEMLDDTPLPATQLNLDTLNLPALKGSRPAEGPRKKPQWVDEQAEYDELMKNAYTTKRGRKKVILSSNF